MHMPDEAMTPSARRPWTRQHVRYFRHAVHLAQAIRLNGDARWRAIIRLTPLLQFVKQASKAGCGAGARGTKKYSAAVKGRRGERPQASDSVARDDSTDQIYPAWSLARFRFFRSWPAYLLAKASQVKNNGASKSRMGLRLL
jgi:hypothetical protein